MTATDYRARWDLPDSYPMVTPNYVEKRSVLAKQLGLGRKGKEVAQAETIADVPELPYLLERKRDQKHA